MMDSVPVLARLSSVAGNNNMGLHKSPTREEETRPGACCTQVEEAKNLQADQTRL